MHPGFDGRLAIKLAQAFENTRKSVLNRVLRMAGIAEDSPRNGTHPASMFAHKTLRRRAFGRAQGVQLTALIGSLFWCFIALGHITVSSIGKYLPAGQIHSARMSLLQISVTNSLPSASDNCRV